MAFDEPAAVGPVGLLEVEPAHLADRRRLLLALHRRLAALTAAVQPEVRLALDEAIVEIRLFDLLRRIRCVEDRLHARLPRLVVAPEPLPDLFEVRPPVGPVALLVRRRP